MRSIDAFHALVILNLLFATAGWVLARPSRPAAAVLVAVGIAWIVWNGPLEGATLISFDPDHGITEFDLLSVVAFGIAGWAWWRTRPPAH
ncbi:hypothetical protein AAFP30_15770 [Gordonia sp. CPCC 205515]|uniref:hypothetical protein n=1 Tax=Gordonia sp. CPCC 205515 TaxID=3140791 RepID=UPI003AF35448